MNLRVILKVAPLLGLIDDLIELAKKRVAAKDSVEDQKYAAELDNLAKRVTPAIYDLLPDTAKDTATEAETLAFGKTLDDLGVSLARSIQAAIPLFKA